MNFLLTEWHQILILLTGPLAVWCTQTSRYEFHKYACLLGLTGQIGWFYSLYSTGQWGGFISSFFYTYAWCVGLHKHWFTPKRAY